jgi:predicted NBD/HSP70 family sugar kinase
MILKMKRESIIGVDLGGTSVTCGLINHSKVEKLISLNISAQKSEQDVFAEIIQTIENLHIKNVAGFGIG